MYSSASSDPPRSDHDNSVVILAVTSNGAFLGMVGAPSIGPFPHRHKGAPLTSPSFWSIADGIVLAAGLYSSRSCGEAFYRPLVLIVLSTANLISTPISSCFLSTAATAKRRRPNLQTNCKKFAVKSKTVIKGKSSLTPK